MPTQQRWDINTTSDQIQTPSSHCKYTNNKDNMFPPKVSAPKGMLPERRNLCGIQDNNSK